MTTFDHPDAIIVGSGAGGGTAARALTERGLRVVVLERGPRKGPEDFLPYDELSVYGHRSLLPKVADDPMVYIDPVTGNPQKVERWWVTNMVGGATMIWEANVPRYTEEDFAVTKYLDLASFPDPGGVSMVDWPWTYQEFHPYFERAEWEWGVSGRARQCAQQEPVRDGYEYPMPPIRAHSSAPFLIEAFGKAGMTPYYSARAINSQTHGGRPACPFCGYCQGYGCAVNDRASSTNTVLARALDTGLCDVRPGHYVTRLHHEKGAIKGVFYKTEPNGIERFLGAPKVFVSVQAIESARLFLLSEIPDPNKLIGRYLTYHTKGSAELTFKGKPPWDEGADRRYQPKTALGSLQLRDLYLIDDKNTFLRKGGKFSIYDPYTVLPPIRMVKEAAGHDGKPLWGRSLTDRLGALRSSAGVSFSFTGETISHHDNRVELDPDVRDPWGVPVSRTYYKHHAYDLALSRYALERVAQIMVDAGAELDSLRPQELANKGYGHVHGTLRAGKDPGSSVLDADCQSHTVKGLYVLDAAFMPTAGASNPTLTQIANAYRVCEKVPA